MIIYSKKNKIKKYHRSIPIKPYGLPIYFDCDYILEKKELYNLLLNRGNYTLRNNIIIFHYNSYTSILYHFIDNISNENRLVWVKLIYLNFNKFSKNDLLCHIIRLIIFINKEILSRYHEKPVKHMMLILYEIINKDINIKTIIENTFNYHGHYNLFYKDLNKIKSFDDNQHMFFRRNIKNISFNNSGRKFKW